MSLNKQKYLPWPFYYAKGWYGVELLESDVDYIISDPKYRLIAQAHEINTRFYRTNCPEKHDKPNFISSEEGVWRDFVEICNAINFFEKFLDDDKCPLRVKAFLWLWLGDQMGYLKVNGCYNDYLQRKFLAQRWQEICR